MTTPYTSTAIPNGAALDKIYTYVSHLEATNNQPIGFLWDPSSNSPTLQRIDINGDNYNPPSSFFDNHSIWGGMRRCVRDRSTGVITYGKYNRGNELDLTGAAGDALVETPNAYSLYMLDGDYREYFTIPYSTEEYKYSLDPCAVQRGGVFRNRFYVSAYEASLRDDNGTLKFQSISGEQPWTGSQIRSIAYSSGNTEFAVGETLTGVTSGATGIVVGYHLSSGAWDGTATGTVYIKNPNVDATTATAFQSGESISRSTGAASAAGNSTTVNLTLSLAETYANNIGAGFGVLNIHSLSYLTRLLLTELGTLNVQTTLGQGIVNLAAGSGFAGKNTGSDNINGNLATNGTGYGDGNDGQRPICWRGIENLYGNIWKYVIGLNLAQDGTFKILNPDGSGTPAAIMSSGYISGSGIPTTGGYISNVLDAAPGALAFLPSSIDNSSSSTYLCDYFSPPTTASTTVLYGGSWTSTTKAGINDKYADASGFSFKSYGVRFEYIPQA